MFVKSLFKIVAHSSHCRRSDSDHRDQEQARDRQAQQDDKVFAARERAAQKRVKNQPRGDILLILNSCLYFFLNKTYLV